MEYKVIISGHLEFSSSRSFGKVLDTYLHRLENYYKNEVLLKQEDLFDEERCVVDIPRFICTSNSDKRWRNTVSMLEMIIQFAIAGNFSLWKLKDGKLLDQLSLEPKCEKAAVQSFLKGRELMTKGKKTEAHQALTTAIDKFERHAQAYERRGFVNFQLGNLEDAFYDFTKSIDINSHNPDAYLGRASVYMKQGLNEAAVADLDKAIKSSIPHQPIYWQARRRKGEALLELLEYEPAEFELRLVTKRRFSPDNPNHKWQRKTYVDYGKALLGLGRYEEAAEALTKARDLEEMGYIRKDEILLFRGIALQKAGKIGYQDDWKAAADQGSKRAQTLLRQSVA